MWAGQSKWDKGTEPMGEINVTPLVDVMLVLLIIFMVTAPLLSQGVNVDLPDAESPAMQQNVEPLVVSIQADGKLFIQKQAIELKQLAPRIEAIRKQKPGLPVFIRGDSKTPYGRVAEVMSLLETAGIRKVGLVTEPHR
ncbi:protein TolR [Mariprofundus ferrooxydans]|uniref:Tol-Pal system protein TolR n=1 Tax=Mariprofundus ferrooxydans PV-1 TaxID=314345 RepID=Q0F2J2_9PROT|nr:protein TolR [Mariprofundus ferrooxydans]EAU55558.1 Biopolymer transport protein [Mariprofundus ferrooxydans PV-1]KON48701.1 biopolymer transporter ExbD [Mariprofundus ferrooxydans]